jgi:uncharacterized protein (TIGR03067 family)
MPRKTQVPKAAIVGATLLGLFLAASQVSPPAWGDDKKRNAELDALKEQDLKKLQGKWVVVREVVRNTVQTGDRGSWVFKGDKVQANGGLATEFTIDVSARPKQLRRSIVGEKEERRTRVYIYTFDDDQLILSSHVIFDEDEAPLDFCSSNHFYRLKRVVD